jgi:hypothetical protein
MFLKVALSSSRYQVASGLAGVFFGADLVKKIFHHGSIFQ